MKKEDLEKFGLSKEQVDGVLSLNDADFKKYKTDISFQYSCNRCIFLS